MNDQVQDRKVALMGETLLCGLLGRVLYGELDRAWLDGLVSEDVFAETPFAAEQPEAQQGIALLQRWSEASRGGLTDEGFAALQKDYEGLFIGVGHVPVPSWESVYCNEQRLVFQTETLQVRGWYRQFGLQIERLHQEPDDHIGLELSFVAHMAGLALQAIEAGDVPMVDQLIQAQRDFLVEHLLRWGPAWAKLVIRLAGTDFFRGLGHLTYGALLAMAETVQVEMPREAAL